MSIYMGQWRDPNHALTMSDMIRIKIKQGGWEVLFKFTSQDQNSLKLNMRQL